MADSIGPNALDRIAGKVPSLVISDTDPHTGTWYSVQLGSSGVISVCSGTDPDGNAVNFVTTYNWDAATSDVLLVAGENYTITSITLSAGIAAVQ